MRKYQHGIDSPSWSEQDARMSNEKWSDNLEPAYSVLKILGGPAAVAEILGLERTTPYRWLMARERRGGGGCIPAKHHQALIDYAAENDIDLSPADFFRRSDKCDAAA